MAVDVSPVHLSMFVRAHHLRTETPRTPRFSSRSRLTSSTFVLCLHPPHFRPHSLQNWGSVKTATDIDIPFWAMQWSDAGAASLAANVKASGANTILGFNEPDVALQSNMTPAFAAASKSSRDGGTSML
jgi:hypothetical protein